MKNTKLIKAIFLFALAVLINTEALAQRDKKNEVDKKNQLKDFFNYCYSNNLFNGSVAVVEDGNMIFKESYGYKNFHQKENIDANTKFLLASLSKQFTAMGIVILKANGKLSYDDEITLYLKDFPYQDITVRQLLNHTSGVPDY